mmetsp:Transcript_10539/g.30168  ORF Transcript_10539/g.30168 Transcript_10539/m.30168 type:complete len:244 (+) Transcript_10539:471-1202(+)
MDKGTYSRVEVHVLQTPLVLVRYVIAKTLSAESPRLRDRIHGPSGLECAVDCIVVLRKDCKPRLRFGKDVDARIGLFPTTSNIAVAVIGVYPALVGVNPALVNFVLARAQPRAPQLGCGALQLGCGVVLQLGSTAPLQSGGCPEVRAVLPVALAFTCQERVPRVILVLALFLPVAVAAAVPGASRRSHQGEGESTRARHQNPGSRCQRNSAGFNINPDKTTSSNLPERQLLEAKIRPLNPQLP